MKAHSDSEHDYVIYPSYDEAFSADHYVEDARSHPQRRKKVHSGKSKYHSRFSKRSTVVLTAMITLLAFSFTIFLADLLGSGSGIGLYSSIFRKKSRSTTYYAVYATHSADMSVQYKNASVIREEGGAGYVMKEGEEYYVILNVYRDEASAKAVSERKANYGLLEIEIYDFDTKKQPSLVVAESCKEIYQEAYNALYESANNLASGKYRKEDMKRALLSAKEKVTSVENSYAERITGTEDTCCIEYKVILAEIRSAFENLERNDEHAVADARYYSAMIIRSYALFTQKYFA